MRTEQEEVGKSRIEKHAKKNKKRRKIRKKAILVFFCVIVLLLVSGLALAGMAIKPPSLDKVDATNNAEEEEREDGIYNVLVVGTDKVGLNTDTILVMSLDSVHHRANVMSIPRDTMSNVTRSVKKINAAYAIGSKKGKGNIENLKKEVSYLMGFEVDNYVVINLSAFEEIIDAIGGVTIDVSRNMDYDDPYQDLHIHLRQGMQTLDGKNAVGFVRYRKGYAEGDLGRVKAQQQFIEAVAKQLASPTTLTKVPKLTEIVLRNMDTDLTNGEILWFAKQAMEVDMDNDLNMFVLPGSAQYVNGLSYYLPDEEEILSVVNQYFNPYATAITSLNIVDVGRVEQQEKVRQSTLTVEQKKQEQKLREQAENEASVDGSGLLTEENESQKTNHPDHNATKAENAGGTTSNGETENNNGYVEPQPSQENNSENSSSGSENSGATEPTQPTDNSGYNTIPGEVLKPETP